MKLLLCVIDAMAPDMLERAVAEGVAPTLGTLIDRGRYVPECVAAFPSVTPVCAASILTGRWQDGHHIPGMNWYDREGRRYVEYGSSLRSAQRFGLSRQLTDTVYNLNRAHLASETTTLFEAIDDAGLRTAGTTYLVYRGRHRHEPRRDGLLTLLASPIMRHPVMGPRELFYADIFSSRPAPCSSRLGMPGIRDQHSGCVGAYLVEHDLFDFLLLSLPDNDWHSHRHGPDGQLRSLALADLQLARVMDAAGGPEAFLSEHAVIVMADHSQAAIERVIDLPEQLRDLGVAAPAARSANGSQVAVCPSQRAAMVYLLDAGAGDGLLASVLRQVLETEGVELAMWLEPDGASGTATAVVANERGAQLRFAPGGRLEDARGGRWSVEGEPGVLELEVEKRRLSSAVYPDALARCWSAVNCPTSGDVLLSAAPGYEFLDWGGQAHVGGGSHGSLRAEDSLGALIFCGIEPAKPEPAQWAIRDVAGAVLAHFGLLPR